MSPPHPLCLLAVLCACGEVPAARPQFEECSAAAGVDVRLTCGEPGAKDTILDVNGNGAALADLDGDGDLDLVLVDGSTRARFLAGEPVTHVVLLNEGPRDGLPRFRRCSQDTGLTQAGWPTGIAAGDVDQDGRVDLAIGGLGEDALFLNRSAEGSVRFEKHALPGRGSPLDWTASLALADGDGDGRLDAYLSRYLTIDAANPPRGQVGSIPCTWHGHQVMCGPHGFPAQPDVYLRGLPAAPWFEDATAASGAGAASPAFGLGVLFADLDQDGWPDVYVANDSMPNTLLANVRQGGFDDVGLLSGAATDASGRSRAGMGVDLGDYDRDGDADLVITNFSDEGTALFRNDGRRLFRDVGAAAGIAQASRPVLGWGVHLADFDADGWLDLYTSNGHVYSQADLTNTGTRYAQLQQYFRGGPDARLTQLPFPDARPALGRGSARGDLDGDGDLDLLTLTLDGAPRLYVNRCDAPERNLLVTLEDGHAPVFGAELTLDTEAGPLVSQALSARGFQTASDPRLHFGGGGTIRAASVRWPGGAVEPLEAGALAFGQHVTVARGRGVIASRPLVAVGGAAP